MDTDPRIGSTIAGCRIVSVIGRGGMGVVYLAEHLHLGRKVALKLLPPEVAGDPAFRDRFVRESRLAATIEHRNVLPIYDAGEVDGLLYIAMRVVHGGDLKDLLAREGPLSTERTLEIVEQVASAMDAAHGAGLVHRDVKPANILVEGERVYLTDFGLTKRTDASADLTKAGSIVGTAGYMAPEQFEGKEVDARTDVYALGCVLYECLTGERPFVRDTDAATMYAHLTEAPPRPTARQPELQATLDDVVGIAMAKRPEQRFQSAGDLASAARRAAEGSAVSVRRRGRLLVAAAVLVAAIGVAATVAIRSREPSPENGGAGILVGPTGPPPAAGEPYVTFIIGGGRLFRVAARPDAAPQDLSAALDASPVGREADEWVSPSDDGSRLLLSTERGGCDGYACLAVSSFDLKSVEMMLSGGEELHARFGAISRNGEVVVFSSTEGPHDFDTWVVRREGRGWTEPVLLTAESRHAVNAWPGLSPDASRVVLQCGPAEDAVRGTSVCETGTDGSGFRELASPTSGPGGTGDSEVGHPHYGSDGSVVFAADWGRAGRQLWRLEAEGPVRVSKGVESSSFCALRDGRFAWLTWSESSEAVLVGKADGSEPSVVARARGILPSLGCA